MLATVADLPSVPYRDPATAVMADPEVPEDKRYCANPACGKPVGRSRDGRPGLTDGFCPHCRTQFSFTPKLDKGDLVAGQYRVLGCLAHGGLGWIYLASDENLDGRWVVLKGLLNTMDPEAIAAAEAERKFLTTLDHPNIVKIHNFQRSAGHGYIVMEYVGGQSLHELRRQGTLPLREALMYGREILHAFAYMHENQKVYCDLKPANVIRVGKRLKLIDMGAVQPFGSPVGSSWGTVGYHAPELDTMPASVDTDLYTVARTLAVLAVPGWSPAKGGVASPLPVDCGHPSFTRLLHRAAAIDPAERFQSAEEMEEQLVGVLREVSALEDGVPYPALSTLFGPERRAVGTALAESRQEVFGPLDPVAAARSLPVPLVDPLDPAAGSLAGLIGRDGRELIDQLAAMPPTPETRLMRVRLLAESGAAEAPAALDELDRELPGDWRVTWYRGVLALSTGQAGQAVHHFDACLSTLPGETAPKLALAFALELAGKPAASWYDLVWRTDRAYVSAAFGLARSGRMGALDEVPASSVYRVAAQVALAASVVRRPDPGTVRAADLVGAVERVTNQADLDPRRRDLLVAEVLSGALAWLENNAPPPKDVRLADAPFTETGLRRRLESLYRRLAVAAESRAERHALIDQANAVRPRTWL
ncbi:serine/threonine-protein kinase [Nonomuraea gerenzanensis]|uniref:non-specific serine/threonine protein kinase n=1 Tax=Nonomuraea gerenzanensis TaxID=93944 RepID=A0A1M4E482_9ACTN|nr:serine/threonine-protein kinase [Nonomuraea gerenzanensis]UBU15845.1 serine/threonine-protein kinase PknG [Nonomuraea gerenzanensis]SBO93636.1 serine/threonine protein kinase [Nonomuraea gerenzanensis]